MDNVYPLLILHKAKEAGDWFVNDNGTLVAKFQKSAMASFMDIGDNQPVNHDDMVMTYEELKDVHMYIYNRLIDLQRSIGHIEVEYSCSGNADIDEYSDLSARYESLNKAIGHAENTLAKLKERSAVTLEA